MTTMITIMLRLMMMILRSNDNDDDFKNIENRDDPDDNYVHGAVHVEYQRMLKRFLPGFVSSDHLQRINYGVVPYEWTCLFVN